MSALTPTHTHRNSTHERPRMHARNRMRPKHANTSKQITFIHRIFVEKRLTSEEANVAGAALRERARRGPDEVLAGELSLVAGFGCAGKWLICACTVTVSFQEGVCCFLETSPSWRALVVTSSPRSSAAACSDASSALLISSVLSCGVCPVRLIS